MTLKKAKLLVLCLLVLGALVGIVALFVFEDGSEGLDVCTKIAAGLLIAGILACGIWCRCPYCGKRLFRNVFRLKVCPSCNRDLETGEISPVPQKKNRWGF